MKLKTYFMATLLIILLPGGQVVSQDDFKPSKTLKAKMMHPDFLARAKEDPEHDPDQAYARLSKKIRELREKIETSPPSEQPALNKILKQMVLAQERLIHRYRQRVLAETMIGQSPQVNHSYFYAGKTPEKQTYLPKKIVMPAEMSGALHWAHRQGIKGQGVNMLILEVDHVTHDDVSPYVTQQRGPDDAGPHANMVASVINQIAPYVSISVNTQLYNSLLGVGPAVQKVEEQGIDIINKSIGSYYEVDGRSIVDFKSEWGYHQNILDLYPKALLVSAIGNRPEEMMDQEVRFSRYQAAKNRQIFALSMSSSRAKGDVTIKVPYNIMMEIKDISLCAMGEQVLVATEGEKYDFERGTSFSAPTISGAAALIKSQYPYFKAEHLQEVLLESADRTFFTEPTQGQPSVFIYDYAECPNGRVIAKRLKVKAQEFSSFTYGKGILSVRNALIYAAILNEKLENKEKWYPLHLRKEMLRRIQMDEAKAATTLSHAWRAYQVRQKSKAIPSSASPVDSAHGESLPMGSIPGTDDLEPETGSDTEAAVVQREATDHR